MLYITPVVLLAVQHGEQASYQAHDPGSACDDLDLGLLVGHASSRQRSMPRILASPERVQGVCNGSASVCWFSVCTVVSVV